MLNEIQVKMLDKGEWPNRVWMAIHGKWDVKVSYYNRRQRRQAKRQKQPFVPHLNYLQLIVNKFGKIIKRIIHRR